MTRYHIFFGNGFGCKPTTDNRPNATWSRWTDTFDIYFLSQRYVDLRYENLRIVIKFQIKLEKQSYWKIFSQNPGASEIFI